MRSAKPGNHLKSELCKQQYSVTHFDCNHLAHVVVLWQMQKFLCYCTGFALLYFEFEGNFQVQAPWGLYLEGDLTNGFLGYEFWGLINEGAYFRNFTPTTFKHFPKLTFIFFASLIRKNKPTQPTKIDLT